MKLCRRLDLCCAIALVSSSAALSVSVIAQPNNPAAPDPGVPGAASTQFIKRSAMDRSLSIEIPANWFYTAQGGHIVATAPQSRAGLIFKVFAVSVRVEGIDPQPNVVYSAYRPPPAFIHDVLAQYHYRSVRVVGWRADAEAAKRCATVVKRDCEAADVVVRFASVEGAMNVGVFKVVNAVPTTAGQWFSVVAGLWGSSQDLASDAPILEQAATSITTADNIARSYLEDPVTQIRLLSTNTMFNSGSTDKTLEAKKK